MRVSAPLGAGLPRFALASATFWIPAFAGMTEGDCKPCQKNPENPLIPKTLILTNPLCAPLRLRASAFPFFRPPDCMFAPNPL